MPLCTHTRTKTHTASLLAKPTPLNINLGSDRFSIMFNNERDISGMKDVDLYLKVRHAVRIEGLSERAAARRFGIDPRTVNKMMKSSVPALKIQI